jgi:hypothetical protein
LGYSQDTCLVLVDAYSVRKIADNCKNNKSRELHKKDILKEGNPFCCIFCCPLAYGFGNGDVPPIVPTLGGIRRYLIEYYPSVTKEFGEFLQQVPEYVLLLRDKKEFSERDFSKFRDIFLKKNGRLRFRNLVVISLDDFD